MISDKFQQTGVAKGLAKQYWSTIIMKIPLNLGSKHDKDLMSLVW